MTSTKNKEGEGAGGTKVSPILLNGCVWFLGERGFPSVLCKDFLHSCGCSVLHCFLEASSITETRGTKVYHESRLNYRVLAFLSVLLYL